MGANGGTRKNGCGATALFSTPGQKDNAMKTTLFFSGIFSWDGMVRVVFFH